jgi:hypothetical protein
MRSVPTNIWRNNAILRYASHRRRQNIFAYPQAEVAAMEVAWWFLARKQFLGGETPAFPFPLLSFMAPPTDFLLPQFETCSTGENAGYGTLTIAVASLGQAKRSKVLRDLLRTLTADAIRRAISFFGVGLSRQAQAESHPRSRPARAKCLARPRGERWMGYA